MRRIISLALMVVLVAGSLFAAGQSETAAEDKVFEATFAHVVRPTIAKGKAAEMFADLVRERSNGRLDISVYPDSQLGNDREITEQMQLGDIEFNAPFTGVLPAFVPQTQLFDLPFAFADSQGAYDAMHGPVGDILNPFLLQQGLRVLGYWDGGFKHITNNLRPVRTPADMAGMRIRVSQSPLLLSQFAALGANGVDIAFAELYTALQQGTVDGQENTLANIFTRRFYEAQKHLTLSEHGYLGYAFLVAESFYQSLPDDLKQIVNETADEVSVWQWEQARLEDAEYLRQLRETDIEIVELTAAEKQAFLEATASVYDVFRSSVPGGDELVEALEQSR
ncbi:MAG TPA: DctP family TRAP transporter solute-binding subunit [Sphaerochaetaceae bacterium]|nr:DctP family TRAP transporter solute-binding subunit [Sphaerochaetaceae bacterium]